MPLNSEAAMAWPDSGYHLYDWNPDTFRWAMAARQIARRVARDPDQQAQWLQCEGTWFVGVDALPSGAEGQAGETPLAGAFMSEIGTQTHLHPAQLSITYPGYPKPRIGESDLAFGYRLRRDAAHMDGLHADGPDRRRYLRERHAWILGIPLTEASPGASPLVVWEGSHHLLQNAFQQRLGSVPDSRWSKEDVTEAYVATRKAVFETCQRRALPLRPGQAVLLNAFLLHGVAPWDKTATASGDGRMIGYFRPATRLTGKDWLTK